MSDNLRYKELKYEGKNYTQKYQIDEILLSKGFNWFLDCEMENMRIEIMKDTLIINGGIFYNGVFEYGVIRDIEWRNGTFQNGVIYNGTFKRIKVEKGIIFDGVFIRGDILFADVRGGEFKDVNISNNVNQTEKEVIPQEQDFKVQPENTQVQTQVQAQPVQVQGEVPKGQDGQEIQSQVVESRIFKTFESFLGGKDKKRKEEQVIKNEQILNDLYQHFKLSLSKEGKFNPIPWFRNGDLIPNENRNNEIITDWAGICLVYDEIKNNYELSIPIKFSTEFKDDIETYINQNYVLRNSNSNTPAHTRVIVFDELTPGFY
jgi:hypothetical protein